MATSVNNFFVFYIFLAVFFTLKVSGQTVLPSMFTDEAFVEDDICSIIINEHPCVKNVLGVLVDHINQNLQRLQVIEEETKELMEERKITQKLLKERTVNENVIQDKLKQNLGAIGSLQSTVNNLQDKLKDTIVQNKKLKTEINALKLERTLSKEKNKNNYIHDYHLKSFFDNFSNSNLKQTDAIKSKLDNSTMVNRIFGLFLSFGNLGVKGHLEFALI